MTDDAKAVKKPYRIDPKETAENWVRTYHGDPCGPSLAAAELAHAFLALSEKYQKVLNELGIREEDLNLQKYHTSGAAGFYKKNSELEPGVSDE